MHGVACSFVGRVFAQSLAFLVDAKAFRALLEVAPSAADDADYQQFVVIVGKYIRERSLYEINIASKTRSEILRGTERKTFKELTLVWRSIRPSSAFARRDVLRLIIFIV